MAGSTDRYIGWTYKPDGHGNLRLAPPDHADAVAMTQAAAHDFNATSSQNDDGIGGLMLALIIIGCYFMPAIIGVMRRHRNSAAIFLFNLFLGWTVLGWIISLVWSATANVEPA